MPIKQRIEFLQAQILTLQRQIATLVTSGTTNPAAHHTTHESGGSDAIKLDDLAAPDDNTDLDASAAKHGLMPKWTIALIRALLDFLGTTRGSVIYRGASGWTTLIPDTAGKVLTDGGVGADPSWQTSGSGYTDENAQDAVGTILADSARIDLAYNDGTPSITADLIAGSIAPSYLDNGSAASVLGRSANSSGARADIASSADGQVLRRASGVVGFGAVDLADSDAVTGLLPIANLAARTTSVQVLFDNNGAELVDNTKARFDIPVNATLTKWRILADQSGSVVFDIWKDTYANYPPTIADTIIGGGGTKPTVSSATKNEDSTLTGYTTSFSAGDTVIVNVDSCTTITQAVLILTFSF